MTALALAPDNGLLAVSSRSLMLRVWSWRDGELVRAFKARRTFAIPPLSPSADAALLDGGVVGST